ERGADDLVADDRQILDATTADEDDRVLLQVVPLTGDVGGDLHLVRQPDARHLPESRVRLLRGVGEHARAHAAALRSAGERRGLRLRLRRDATLSNQLIYGGHPAPSSLDFGHKKRRRGDRALPTATGRVAKAKRPSTEPNRLRMPPRSRLSPPVRLPKFMPFEP